MERTYYRKGVIGIVWTRKDLIEYLLLHRMRPWVGWGLLKGSKDDKSERTALRLELSEEADIKYRDVIREERISDLRIRYKFPKAREKGYHCIGQNMQAYSVEVRPRTKIRVDYEENDGYCWAELKKAKEMLRFDNHKTSLESADEFIRTHLLGNLQNS